jgi:hypothetical protein
MSQEQEKTAQTSESARAAMKSAMLAKRTDEQISVAVKAEDLPMGGGIDYSLIFWEPQVGKTYTVKFLKCLEDVATEGNRDLQHRKVYKNLPDPTRKGKTFQMVSSGNAKTDKVLELFFELNGMKKQGNALAAQKIEDFLSNTNQGCCVVQVQQSPEPTEIGIIRLFTFSTFGPNASIANLINEKLNPTEAQLKNDYVKEDIFAIYGTSSLIIECNESEYGDEKRKGRDFTKSSWSKKSDKGAWVKLEDGTEHTFNEKSFDEAGNIKPEFEAFFDALLDQLLAPNLSIHNYFAYKTIGHPLNTKDTEDYLVNLQKKVDEIVPVIRNAKSIAEITAYGVAGSSEESDSAQTISGAKASDILKESVPSELANSILNEGEEAPATEETAKAAKAETVKDEAPAEDLTQRSEEVNDILNS